MLVGAERTWGRWVMDKSIDYVFLNRFMAVFQGPEQAAHHPPCLRVHQIVVDPATQSKGVGRMLIDWGESAGGQGGVAGVFGGECGGTGVL